MPKKKDEEKKTGRGTGKTGKTTNAKKTPKSAVTSTRTKKSAPAKGKAEKTAAKGKTGTSKKAAKKPTAGKSTTKKSTAKKSTVKKSTGKKTATKKSAGKKSTARKTAPKRSPAGSRKASGTRASGRAKNVSSEKITVESSLAPASSPGETTRGAGHPSPPPTHPGLFGGADHRETEQPVSPAIRHVFDHGRELPDGYGETRIVLMYVDPSWMHTYWEITGDSIENARRTLGDEYDTAARNLRVKRLDGRNNGDILEHYDIGIGDTARNWYLRVPHADSSYQVEVGLLTRDGGFHVLAASNMITVPRDGMSDVIDEQWTSDEKNYFERVYALSGGFQVGVGSLDLQERMAEILRAEISSGAIGSFALGSEAFGQPEKKRSFWFRVGTELIVYGATDPRARVTLMGEPIQLESDGTFTVRFALPDGLRNIPIVAESPDGVEEREIDITVTRESEEKEPVLRHE